MSRKHSVIRQEGLKETTKTLIAVLKEAVLVLNMSMSLHTTLAAEAQLEERQYFLEEQIWNKENSLIYLAEIRRAAVFKTEGQIITKVNLNKEQCINMILPLTS
jgi:hypothetical protein